MNGLVTRLRRKAAHRQLVQLDIRKCRDDARPNLPMPDVRLAVGGIVGLVRRLHFDAADE